MDGLDLEALRDDLLERRERLRRGQGSRLDELGQSADHAIADSLDLASEAADFAVAVNAASIESQELGSIDKALQRMDAGSYGQCEGCDEQINPKRISALPFATLCIDCQRRLEDHGGYARTISDDLPIRAPEHLAAAADHARASCRPGASSP